MTKLLLMWVGLLTVPDTAAAQPPSTPVLGHFIQASWFADLRKWDWPGTPRARGASIAIGHRRESGKTFAFEVEIPQFAHWFSEHIGRGGPPGTDAPLLGSRRWQQSRIATMALLWELSEKPDDRRVSASWLAGFGVHIQQKRFRDETWRVDTPADVRVIKVNTGGVVPAAVLGIDGLIKLNRRVEMVPNARLFVTYGSFILRPGLGARVNF